VREQIHADGAIHRERPSPGDHQGEAGGNQEDGKLEGLEACSPVNKNQDAAHEENNGQGSQPSKETEREREAHGKLLNEKESDKEVREVMAVRACPKRDRVIPPGPPEPAERVLHAMVERYGRERQSQKKRRKAAGRGKKGINGIVRHGADASKRRARRKAKVSPALSLSP
jgi:hypothetical protein